MILLLGLWAFYFCLHSGLASVRPKQWFQRKFPHWPFRYYRIIFNLFFLFGLIGMVWFHLMEPSKLFYHQSMVSDTVGPLLISTGSIIMFFAGMHYDLKSFSGFADEKTNVLRTDKLNRWVRHPLYSGTSILFIGVCITWPFYKNLYLLLLYFIYLTIGMYLEERKLVNLYGQEYKSYQKRTKKLVPFVW